MVDTPGFGGDMEEEEDTIDGLVNFLREDLMYVDAFVIAFKQSDSRPTVAYRTMIKLIDGIFGDELWDHVMIEATWWSYSPREVNIREQKDNLFLAPPSYITLHTYSHKYMMYLVRTIMHYITTY